MDAMTRGADGLVERFYSDTPHGWLRPICDHNPFYLLSGVSLLGGAYLVNSAAHEIKDSLGIVLGLLAVFAVYETLICVLSAWLLRRQGMTRDAGWLLGLMVLLLADATLVYQEALTMAGWAGVAVGVLAIGGGLIKAELVAWIAGVRWRGVDRCVLCMAVVSLFALPMAMRQVKLAEGMGPMAMYAAWWVVAGVWACWGLTYRSGRAKPSAVSRPLARVMSGWLLGVPVVSLTVHLAVLQWVYEVPWSLAMSAPMAIGAAAALILARRPRLRADQAITVAWGAAIVAGAVSLSGDELLTVRGWIEWSPLRSVSVGLLALGVIAIWRFGGWGPALPCGCVLGLGLIGPDVTAIGARLEMATKAIAWLARRGLPRSMMGWGVVGLALSFVLLTLGVGVTWLGRRPARAG
ncbi:MAG: hypothetical protein AAGK09_01950 [Planctomycetota bacterium]